jgi:hypothetical protein
MTNLSRFQTEDGIELVIDTTTGDVAYPGFKALARVCSLGLNKPLNHTQIQRFLSKEGGTDLGYLEAETLTLQAFEGGTNLYILKTELETDGGSQITNIISRRLGAKAIKKFNPDLYDKMSDAGHVVFLHQLAGYKVSSTAVEPPKPQTMLEWAEAFVASEKARLVAEEAKLLLQAENEVLKQEVEGLSEIVDELFDYSSIIRIAKFNNVPETRFEWWVLKKASKAENLEIKKAPCQRYGQKNLYNHTAWRRAYPGIKLPETTTLTRINAD